jgi:hypothetical protein
MEHKNDLSDKRASPSSSRNNGNVCSVRRRLKLIDESHRPKEKTNASLDEVAPWFIINPESPLGLLEELFCGDPWRLLISTIFLNRTSRVQVDVVLHHFLQQWPTALVTSKASPESIADVVGSMGMREKRAHGIVRFSKDFLQLLETKAGSGGQQDRCRIACSLSEKEILGLYYCGDYAYAAYKVRVLVACDI